MQYGAVEPLYQPAQTLSEPHVIYSTQDYVASALHEVAHWCVAGKQRRKLIDYGYWYAPDGRDAQQQAVFEQVEIKPQAIEKAFSGACGVEFSVSIDNLAHGAHNYQAFEQAINEQYLRYQQSSYPPRAQRFIYALQEAFT